MQTALLDEGKVIKNLISLAGALKMAQQ